MFFGKSGKKKKKHIWYGGSVLQNTIYFKVKNKNVDGLDSMTYGVIREGCTTDPKTINCLLPMRFTI